MKGPSKNILIGLVIIGLVIIGLVVVYFVVIHPRGRKLYSDLYASNDINIDLKKTGWDGHKELSYNTKTLNGKQLISCSPDDGKTFPIKLPYNNNFPTGLSKNYYSVNTKQLPRASGEPGKDSLWSVSITHSGDQLLWIAGLAPNKPHTLKINDNLSFHYTANEQGMIVLADIPFPIAALPNDDIRLVIESESSLPASRRKTPTVMLTFDLNSVKELVELQVESDKTLIIEGKKTLLLCSINNKESNKQVVYRVYTTLNNNDKRTLESSYEIPFKMLTTYGSALVKAKDGELEYNYT